VFSRAELVQKTAQDLGLSSPTSGLAPDRVFNVGALSLGYIADFMRWSGATPGLGAMGTLNVIPRNLEGSYGSRTPLGGWIFLRLRPLHSEETTNMGGMHMDGDAFDLAPSRR
jgi:hypothetical protein